MDLKPKSNKYTVKIDGAAVHYSDKTIKIIVNAMLTNQLSLFYNERLKGTPQYKHKLKQGLTIVIKELLKVEKTEFEDILSTVGKSTDMIHENQFDMIEALGNISPGYYIELAEVLKAFAKAPKNLTGLAKKINKNS